ncbi:GNAT family N-acetyltransferase [Dongia soli]|uniref:GNAT family N-acetyltransferase n=1 Tax=Dongia soli TaxID=600628 RepID=A0ABU5ED47_9PROT|nr:GNAT family N-acetyltransferase [Dongia soli]MDY0884290.1 GNAT family N-acetyltransferase [Dongia soli]
MATSLDRLPSPLPLVARLIGENDLTAHDRQNIRSLLIAAFPQHQHLWTQQDSWGGPSEYRLLLMERTGRVAAHLGFARRLIKVGETTLLIAGIGAVAVLPDLQGQQVGKQLLRNLRQLLCTDLPVDFGFLQCRDAVVGFYDKAGFSRVAQQVRSFDPDKRLWQIDDAAAMVLPVGASIDAWPAHGIVDLMGMPW